MSRREKKDPTEEPNERVERSRVVESQGAPIWVEPRIGKRGCTRSPRDGPTLGSKA